MLVAPVVFLTVVLGIAGAADVKKAGRVGLKSLVYFEVVSTFALALVWWWCICCGLGLAST